jgi:hypothetical protein
MMSKPVGQYLGGIIGLLLCLFLLVIVTFGSFLLLPAHLHYHIEEKYLFLIEEGDAVIRLGVLIPRSGPYQEVKNIKISWGGVQERENRPYIEVIQLTGELGAGKDKEAIISYDVILPNGKVSWEGPIEEFHYLPQTGIESDHPRLEEAVSDITTDSTLKDAYRIYDYVSEYLIYTIEDRDCTSSSALKAFITHTGVCGEFARLTVAFCRIAGIPAQVISGIVLPDLVIFGSSQNRIRDHPGESHAWVECCAEGQWTMADPTTGSGYLNWLQFGSNDGHHLSYREFEQEGKTFVEMARWVKNHGTLIDSEHASLKFAASADSGQVSITPSSYIRKGWDGRWVNTLVSLTLTTFILCKLRNRLIQQKTNSSIVNDSR